MKLTIQDKKGNVLLDRVEVSGSIDFEGATPSNVDVTKEVAKQLSSEVSLVVIKNIYTKFSTQTAAFTAFVYKNTDALSKTERMTKHLRKKGEADAKKRAEEEEEKKAAKAKAAEEAKAVAEAKAAEEVKPAEEESAEEPKKEEGEQ